MQVPISSDELQNHLNEQISFLESSAELFDAGREEEAKRLAVTIRTLVHDTNNSHSLLEQMGKKHEFYDSSLDLDPKNILPQGTLISLIHGLGKSRYVPNLDNFSPEIVKMVEFDSWWNKHVFVDKQCKKLSRKDLILIAANQDGGAHVDPSLDETYAHLSRNGLDLIVSHGAGLKRLDKLERVAIRQIAHEVLKTLKPGYKKKLEYQAGELCLNVKITDGAEDKNDGESPERKRKIGRNEPCPCGSGLKFKKCCGSNQKT